MGFKDFFKIDGDQWGLSGEHLEGLNGVAYNTHIALRTWPDKRYVVLKCQEEMILPFNQIVRVNFITWEKTIVKALNPMAEGIVGGLIGGDAMAVVSAIDAKGRTRAEKVKVPYALEIQYHPKGDSRTVKSVVMAPTVKGTAKEWAETLSKYAGLPAPQYIQPEKKGPTYL